MVDTGVPEDFPDQVVDDKTQIFLGNKIKNYIDALKDLGYQPSQVSKILITHKHPDHTGALKHFPNAKIYAARDTLNKVREFIRNNPTVYCSTHTPLGYENLDNKNLKICRQIGNVRDVSSRKINLIKRNFGRVLI